MVWNGIEIEWDGKSILNIRCLISLKEYINILRLIKNKNLMYGKGPETSYFVIRFFLSSDFRRQMEKGVSVI